MALTSRSALSLYQRLGLNYSYVLPIVVGSEGGPCPSLLDAESATLTTLDDWQRSEGTPMRYLQTFSVQGVFSSNGNGEAELYDMP